ncbi:MAG: hypothetical protein JXR40_12470 [Pontiellaceae bacterium]|nr:hypothetical protein [Pontiellaceae bacterium]
MKYIIIISTALACTLVHADQSLEEKMIELFVQAETINSHIETLKESDVPEQYQIKIDKDETPTACTENHYRNGNLILSVRTSKEHPNSVVAKVYWNSEPVASIGYFNELVVLPTANRDCDVAISFREDGIVSINIMSKGEMLDIVEISKNILT